MRWHRETSVMMEGLAGPQEGRAWSRELAKDIPGWVVARRSRQQLLRVRKEAEN